MLQSLIIENIAIIDRTEILFEAGFNVLTGETGAGKSIIIDSISAILGERVSKDLIRSGKEKAFVEATFHISDQKITSFLEQAGIGLEEDGTLIISREFNAQGKNICRINMRSVTVSILNELGQLLIDVHGQHDNQSLLKISKHIELLDDFANKKIRTIKKQYIETLQEYNDLKIKINSIMGDAHERERKIDLLKFQVDEIKNAKLKLKEDEELFAQRTFLANSEKIMNSLNTSFEILYEGVGNYGSILENIKKCQKEISNIVSFKPEFEAIYNKIDSLFYEFEDVSENIRIERDASEFEPQALEGLEERLDLIYKLKKKYGNSIEEITEYYKLANKQLSEILNSEELVNELNLKKFQLAKTLYKMSQEMNVIRNNTAIEIEEKISKTLSELEMKSAKFKVLIKFEGTEDFENNQYSKNGLNKVEFLFSANAGELPKPLAKIASGGEMSRVMLAIKSILAGEDKVPTLIFDEVDAGISGKTAQKVGEKLALISKSHQVLCVSHLSQIAVFADNHLLIEKQENNQATTTSVKNLTSKESCNEIARINGGSLITELSLKHAEELILNARNIKNSI